MGTIDAIDARDDAHHEGFDALTIITSRAWDFNNGTISISASADSRGNVYVSPAVLKSPVKITSDEARAVSLMFSELAHFMAAWAPGAPKIEVEDP